jgi:hypothetical protein
MSTRIANRLVVAPLVLVLLCLGSCAGKSVYVPAGSVTQSADFSDTDMHDGRRCMPRCRSG